MRVSLLLLIVLCIILQVNAYNNRFELYRNRERLKSSIMNIRNDIDPKAIVTFAFPTNITIPKRDNSIFNEIERIPTGWLNQSILQDILLKKYGAKSLPDLLLKDNIYIFIGSDMMSLLEIYYAEHYGKIIKYNLAWTDQFMYLYKIGEDDLKTGLQD